MNTFQRLGQSPTGAYWQDTVIVDGYVTHEWRHATEQEAASLRDPRADPNYGIGRIFGYEEKAFMARQYK